MRRRYSPAKPEEIAGSTWRWPGWSSTKKMARMFRSMSLLLICERGLPPLQESLLSPLPTGSGLVLFPDDWLQADFSSFDGHCELVLLSQTEFLSLFLGDQDPTLPVQFDGMHTHDSSTTFGI